MVAQLIKIFPNFIELSLLHNSWEHHPKLFQSMNSQIPSWYSTLKSTKILYSHIHTGLLNALFPSRFAIKNLFKITLTLMHATFLTNFVLFFNTPVSGWQCKLWNSTKCILFCPLPVFPVSSLCSQTQQAYKWQKTLPSLKSHFSCYSFNTSSYNLYLNKQNGLIKMESNRSQTTFHITHRLQYVPATRRHLHSFCVKRYK